MSIILEKIKTEYLLKCVQEGKTISDDGFRLVNPRCADALLRADYAKKQLSVGSDELGIFKFADWLPVNHSLNGSSSPITFKSVKLAAQLGLDNLFITFSGYWPERGVFMETGTFKECEAFPVCARLPEDFDDVLVVASAGNTARAFARVCSENNIKLLLVVPDDRREKLWFKEQLNSCVQLITVGGNSDYYDAIKLAEEICKMPGFIPEGGAKNVARRDGMGITVLSAVTTIGEIPDYYFQAVGSGTGAVAAWEANLRFNESGAYNDKKMSLQVAQNFPFVPMYDAWKAGSRELFPIDEEVAKVELAMIYGDVLANRKPAYGIQGGMYDALADTKGDVHAITNEEAKKAAALFESEEGIDMEPAAAVALGALIKSVESKRIDKQSLIMLNVTGGGIKRFKRENNCVYLQPSEVVDVQNTGLNDIKETITKLFN